MSLIQVVVGGASTVNFVDGLQERRKAGAVAFLKEVSREWLGNIDKGFASESNPYGQEWAPLSPFTVRLKKSSRRLYESGALSKSFKRDVRGDGFLIDSSEQELADKQASGTARGSVFPFAIIPSRVMVPDADNLPPLWQAQIDSASKRFLESF